MMTSRIYSETHGSGPVVLLLHGFPMNHHVWDEFIKSLPGGFTYVTPDLPGFGKSALLQEGFSIDDVANEVNKWIDSEGLQPAVLIGHSLGGYVALAMTAQNPSAFKGLVLFHSTAEADSDDKKESRSKVLEFIDQHGAHAFTSNFIEPLFTDPEHPGISVVKDLSVGATKEAVQGYTRAMRDRPGRTEILRTAPWPVLIIGGENDKAIPASALEQQVITSGGSLVILEGAAHMGMFEKREEAAGIIRDFLFKIFPSAAAR
jgi:pimeloyl-ACP methyl ester carboxylesterase